MAKPQEIVMTEMMDFLEQQERGVFWLPPQAPRKASPSRRRVFAPLDPSSIDTGSLENESFDLVVELIAIQLLASCYTLLPAMSANNFPISQQRKESRAITALRLHTYYHVLPTAGYHARESSETSPWPGLYHGSSREEKLAEIVSKQRRWTTGTHDDEQMHETQSLIVKKQVKRTRQCNDGTEDSYGFSEADAPSLPSPYAKLMSRFSCTPTSRGKRKTLVPSSQSPSMQIQNSWSSEEPDRPVLERRPSPVKKSSSVPVLKISSTIRQRIRPTKSHNENVSDDSKERPGTLGPRRNSSDSAIHTPRAHLANIPEIRRISASTDSQASTPTAPQVYRSDLSMETPPILLKSTERRLSNVNRSPLGADGFSPFDTSVTPLTSRRRSSYFITPLPTTREENARIDWVRETSPVSERTIASRESSCSSDDSFCRNRRNRSMIGSAADLAAEFSSNLKKLSEEEPLEAEMNE